MSFLVLIYDYADVTERRDCVRGRHIEYQRPFAENGVLLVGGALLDGEGSPIGSVAIVTYEAKEQVENWIHNDPYFVEHVWNEISILPIRTAEDLPFFRDNFEASDV